MTRRLGSAPKALLLDLDRTLIDVESYVDYCAAVADLRVRFPAAELGATPDTTGWGSCTKEAVARLVGLAGTPEYPAAAALVAQHELVGAPHATAMPGLGEFMDAVAGRPIAIVTLLGPEATELVLARHGVSVDAVVPRRPDLRPKPFPDQVAEGLRLIGVDGADAVMVGDSATDLQAAHACGVRFVGITNGRTTPEFGAVPTADTLIEALELI